MLTSRDSQQKDRQKRKLNQNKSLQRSSICCWQESITECVGTFILIFAGTGAVMVNAMTGGSITHLGISFVFGAVVAALIYATGHISQAHLNPAVTLAFWTSGFFPKRKVIPYIIAQFTGAIAASGSLLIALGKVADLGATKPLNGNWMQSLILEVILTFILMFVIFGSGLDRRAHNGFAGLAIGLTVGLEAAFMGPITGASMNPARSLAPALVGGIWQYQWVYLVAPIVGAQLAVLIYGTISQGFKDIR
jgi:MIP family channel proteins